MTMEDKGCDALRVSESRAPWNIPRNTKDWDSLWQEEAEGFLSSWFSLFSTDIFSHSHWRQHQVFGMCFSVKHLLALCRVLGKAEHPWTGGWGGEIVAAIEVKVKDWDPGLHKPLLLRSHTWYSCQAQPVPKGKKNAEKQSNHNIAPTVAWISLCICLLS